MDPLEYLFGLERFGIKFGLGNICALVDSLGHPDRAFRSLHVAGTNGKGSVTAIVAEALRAAGLRSARFTSPHLIDLTERFVIDGRPVPLETLVSVVREVRGHIDRLLENGALESQPTFFEVTTAVALELFRRARVEVAVLEVGMGGRLDSTNVITPVASAITSIAFDHERHLGYTLAEIATEKAGIIKAGIPVVVGPVDREPAAAIQEVARERGAPLMWAEEGVTIEPLAQPPGTATRVRLRTPEHNYGDVTIALRGTHQIHNAIVAVRLLELFNRLGRPVPPRAVVEGLKNVSWPGRLEHRTLMPGREMILDAAHNPAGAATLAAYLRETFDRKLPLVFAAMVDKDARRIFEALLPSVSALVITRVSNPRTADPIALAAIASSVAPELPVQVYPALHDALSAAWDVGPLIVVAGSIFLLGDVFRETGLSWYSSNTAAT